jgi:hypothetical protein
MGNYEFIEMACGILFSVLYITCCVLSIVFLLTHRENRWRWLPCLSVIGFAFILAVPESGWSDFRSQWHQSALFVAWSIGVLLLVPILRKSSKGRVLVVLRCLLGAMGTVGFAMGVVSLIECWSFLHGL